MGIKIRKETKQDIEKITEIIIAAFKSMEISNQTEHLIINALRSANALSFSLVADMDRRSCGAHCLFTCDHF